MKKIIVTGGSGFIGSNLSKMLISKGYKVVVFDNNIRGKKSRIDLNDKNIKYIN